MIDPRSTRAYKLEKKNKELKKEIERLNKLILQREKKWEKWTTEKTILSTKMSDYLCKYQNIKREYTKQIKISTDRKKEVERLNNIINETRRILGEYRHYSLPDEQQNAKNEAIVDEAYHQLHNNLKELKGSESNE